ncbi:class I SAM-dependent methyltransferase [Denitratisoma sp. agr-D3]
MTPSLEKLLRDLERFGAENDEVITQRPRRMLNITRDTGEFLGVLVRACRAREVLEIGTSNGYSTLWLAEAAKPLGGRVRTVEMSEFKAGLADENFFHSGLADAITLITADAAKVLAETADGSVDLLFLDAEREQYCALWPDLRRVLRPDGGLLVVDNAVSHAEQLVDFMALVGTDAEFRCSLVPVGNGEFLAVRGS